MFRTTAALWNRELHIAASARGSAARGACAQHCRRVRRPGGVCPRTGGLWPPRADRDVCLRSVRRVCQSTGTSHGTRPVGTRSTHAWLARNGEGRQEAERASRLYRYTLFYSVSSRDRPHSSAQPRFSGSARLHTGALPSERTYAAPRRRQRHPNDLRRAVHPLTCRRARRPPRLRVHPTEHLPRPRRVHHLCHPTHRPTTARAPRRV